MELIALLNLLYPTAGKAADHPISNPPWTEERRLTAREFTGQASPKSSWLRIQSVNRVFALTLTEKGPSTEGIVKVFQTHPWVLNRVNAL